MRKYNNFIINGGKYGSIDNGSCRCARMAANEIFGYQAPQEGEASIGMVILLGVGIVFLGLICLVIVCSIFGLIGKATNRSKKKKEEIVPAAAKEEEIPDRQEFVAAVSAAIAEELGTDVSAIRILSIKRM